MTIKVNFSSNLLYLFMYLFIYWLCSVKQTGAEATALGADSNSKLVSAHPLSMSCPTFSVYTASCELSSAFGFAPFPFRRFLSIFKLKTAVREHEGE